MDFKEFFILIYRMMPFIIVAFLVISSLFSGEFSGFLLLVGIMVTSLITIIISHTDFIKNDVLRDENGNENNKMAKMMECSLLTINNSVLSYLPLSTHTIAFIFGYFIYVIVTNKRVVKNALLIAMVTILVFIDVVYNFNSCAEEMVIIPLIIGVFSGVLWAVIIGKKNQMIPQQDKASKCSVTKGMYKCRIKRTGQIVS
jgi:hypothetical protein